LNLCQEKRKKLWIRQVIVPGINDTKQHIIKLKTFIKKIKHVEKVELLPYHDMAKEKYKKLKLNYRLQNTPPMEKSKCDELYQILIEEQFYN
ncbi:MAG: pyruvate formate-lyase 1-activating enzyme, partial [Clostridia bacterium]|nr:pyruvate formate-lyase 1-activating enzyme [Clostridia bacterium]